MSPQAPVRPRKERRPPVDEPLAFASSPPPWEEAVAAYLRDCRRRNLSPQTIEQYEWVLRSGTRIKVWREDYAVVSAADLTGETLRALESDLTEAGMAATTVGTIHRRIHSFGLWCEQAYGLDVGVRTVKPPIETSGDPETYTEAQLDRILAAATTDRDRVLVRVLLHTGVRAGELLNLSCDDFITSPDGAWLHVRQGKGRKDRIVPLDTPGCRLSKMIDTYMRTQRPKSESRSLFLCELRDGDGVFVPLGRRGLSSLMRRLSDRTGIHVHAHAFRHTFATRSIAAGVNPLVLQRVLGHTTLRMVNYYVHMQPFDILEAWSKRLD